MFVSRSVCKSVPILILQASWATSSKKQSDRLLEVIRRLAEDDKDGVMANKVRQQGVYCGRKQLFIYI